ncbi:hypothetical protein AB1L42_14370 [Thalassoglobus sp. JC818]|uniref:hypothetical protein n=1 Tax=Thalassoglobus sp. JC818 TaxID=3232136 RepID=UPI0034576B6A
MNNTLQQLRQKLVSLQRNPSVLPRSAAHSLLADHQFCKELPPGTVVEWISENGSGTGSLVFQLIRPLLHQRNMELVIVDPRQEFNPTGLFGNGGTFDRMLILRPHRKDVFWTYEQVLRSTAGVLAIGPLERVLPSTYRRFKLAAEHGRGIAMFLRPSKYRHEPSWADYRIHITPQPGPRQASLTRVLQMELLHVRGGRTSHQPSQVIIHDDASVVRVDSQLAHPASMDRSA